MKIAINQVIANTFVTRQTSSSPYSHSDLSFEEVAQLLHTVPEEMISEGYRPASYEEGGRVILARLTPEQSKSFYSAVTIIQPDDVVREGYRPRVEGEDPRPYREVVREVKPQAQTVDLVFYNSISLAQDGNNQLDARADNWELISINASEDEVMDAPPITPTALEANFKGLSGGTLTQMTQEEYEAQMLASRAYWDTRATIRLRSSIRHFSGQESGYPVPTIRGEVCLACQYGEWPVGLIEANWIVIDRSGSGESCRTGRYKKIWGEVISEAEAKYLMKNCPTPR